VTFDRGEEVSFEEHGKYGYKPPVHPQSELDKPNYQVVFVHDTDSSLFEIKLPGYADNGTYFVKVRL
jgi:hypothetical protein